MEVAVFDKALFVETGLRGVVSVEPVDLTDADPLEADRFDDVPIITSHRRLLRLAIVAAETGARFVREDAVHDPMAWMTAPRDLFRGASALDACQERDGFMRATLLHGLGLGLDADADAMDALLDDEERDFPFVEDFGDGQVRGCGEGGRLFTCFVSGVEVDEARRVQAFCAAVVPDGETMRRRVARRFGVVLADGAIVHEGIDLNHPAANALVSDGLLRMLAMAEREPDGEFGRGLDVVLEQRSAA